MRKGIRGRGVKVRHFLKLLCSTDGLAGRYPHARITVGGKRRHCRLPANLPLSDSVLSLFGYYVAAGNARSRFFTLRTIIR